MSVDKIYIESDNELTVSSLRNTSDGSFINDASVVVTLFDAGGGEVGGQVWPLTMGYVSGSDGDYKTTLSDELVLEKNKRYRAKVVADAGAGKKRTWWKNVKAVEDG